MGKRQAFDASFILHGRPVSLILSGTSAMIIRILGVLCVERCEIVSCAMDIGESMLTSGAEVYRVEDCITRICMAYGAVNVNVFSITSSIVLTVDFPEDVRITQTRRIKGYTHNLDRVDRLNQLSRQICRDKLPYDEIRENYLGIMKLKPYSHIAETAAFAMIAAVFTVFFGGNWQDALISAVIGIVLRMTVYFANAVNFNRVLSNLISSFVMSVLAFVAVRSGIAESAEMIIIGNIMLLIPGVLLTNSIRDMISGDTMTGILRFAEAIILALAIAGGYILASYVVGGTLL